MIKRYYKNILTLILFIYAAGLFTGCSTNEDAIWFDDITYKYELTPDDQQALGSYVYSTLFDVRDSELTPKLADDNLPRIVFVSVSDGKTRAKVFMGRGYGIIDAINNAVSKAEDYVGNKQNTLVKVDIVNEVIPEVTESLDFPMMWDRSLFGLAFERGSGLAFLPEEIVANSIINSKQLLKEKKIRGYVGDDSDKKDEIKKIFKQKDPDVYRFSVTSFSVKNKRVTPLYRGHKIFNKLTAAKLLDAAIKGGTYLANAVKPDGRFLYLYYPKSSKEADEYNLVRHAGTIFSMLQLYQETRDSLLLKKSELALEYLKRTIKPLKTAGGTYYCSVEKGNTKLGGNALAAIAFLYHYQITKESSSLKTAQQLGEWIQMSQNKSGEFYVQKQYYPSGEVTDFRSDYYPGEALLALTMLYEADANEKWLDIAERGAKYLINVRDGDKTDKELQHDHWLLYGLNKLYRYRPDKLYFNHAMRLADVIIESQRINAEFSDWTGSFYSPPRSTPTATRMEGLYNAYELAKDFGDEQTQHKIRNALERGVKFELQTQFDPVTAMYLDDPQRAMGGFKSSLTNYKIRIDYVQHNISSLLGMYSILKEETEK